MYETFESLPESTTTAFAPDYAHKPKREIETRWDLGEAAEGTVVLEVTSSHDTARKEFRSRITWATMETKPLHPADGSGFYTSWRWSTDHHMYSVLCEPVARYSAKALEKFHADSLAMVEANYQSGSLTHSVVAQAVEMSALDEEDEYDPTYLSARDGSANAYFAAQGL